MCPTLGRWNPDIHKHPRAASAIHQGVTTEVVGNCGFGCFPIRDPSVARRAIYGYSDELPVTWSSAAEYFDVLAAAKPAVNVLSLVPNGQLRIATLGVADRPADARELAEMQGLLRESLEAGAWGYSTGLEYAQEQAATEDELTALAAQALMLALFAKTEPGNRCRLFIHKAARRGYLIDAAASARRRPVKSKLVAK